MSFPSGPARPAIDSKSRFSTFSSPAQSRLPFRAVSLFDQGWGPVGPSLSDATTDLAQPLSAAARGAFTGRLETPGNARSSSSSSSSSSFARTSPSDRETESGLTLMANSASLKRARPGQERETESESFGKRHQGVNRLASRLEAALPDSQFRDLIGSASGEQRGFMEGLASKPAKSSLDADDWDAESESDMPKRLAFSLGGLESCAEVWRGRVERHCAALQLEEASNGAEGGASPMAGPVQKLAEAEKLFNQRWLPVRLALEQRMLTCDRSIEQIETLQADAQSGLREWQSVVTRISEVARQWRELQRAAAFDRSSQWAREIAWENRELELMQELLFPVTLELELELHLLAEQHRCALPDGAERGRKGFFDASGLRCMEAGQSIFTNLLKAPGARGDDEPSLEDFCWETGGALIAAHEAGLAAQFAKSRLNESLAVLRNVRLEHGALRVSDQTLKEAKQAVSVARQESQARSAPAREAAAKVREIKASSPEVLKRLMIGAAEHALPHEALYQEVDPLLTGLRRDLSRPPSAGLFDVAVQKSREGIQRHIKLTTVRGEFLTAARSVQEEGTAALGRYQKAAVQFSDDLEIAAMTLLDARLRWQDCARASALDGAPVDPRFALVIEKFDALAAELVADFSTLKREVLFLGNRERVAALQVDQAPIGPVLPTVLSLLKSNAQTSVAFSRPDPKNVSADGNVLSK